MNNEPHITETPLLEGMTTKPYGLPMMAGFWWSCVLATADEPKAVEAFRKETGLKLCFGVSPLERMIDKAAGRDKSIVVAWCDWVTRNVWGEEEPQGKGPVSTDSTDETQIMDTNSNINEASDIDLLDKKLRKLKKRKRKLRARAKLQLDSLQGEMNAICDKLGRIRSYQLRVKNEEIEENRRNRFRMVLRMHAEGKPLQLMGKAMGVTRERARQILFHAERINRIHPL